MGSSTAAEVVVVVVFFFFFLYFEADKPTGNPPSCSVWLVERASVSSRQRFGERRGMSNGRLLGGHRRRGGKKQKKEKREREREREREK
jgi:hypothetical protein